MPPVPVMVGLIGGGPVSFLVILVLGVVGAVLWAREHPQPDAAAGPSDAPVRLLQWGVGLLSADRTEWGHAMLGELDQLEGSLVRWRFALACVVGIVGTPRWTIGPLAALGLVTTGSAVVIGVGFIHFGLAANPWNWVMLAVVAAVVVSSLVGASVQLRRPQSSMLGLGGGLFIAAAWLAASRFTFLGLISPINSVGSWSGPGLLVAVPVVLGVASAWRSGSASVGRRAVRLAGVSAGLVMFCISTVAVVAIDGGPRDPGVGVAGGVSESFFDAAMLFLIMLPLATTAVGWVAATATSRIGALAVAHGMPMNGGVKSRALRPAVLRAIVVTVVIAAVIIFIEAR